MSAPTSPLIPGSSQGPALKWFIPQINHLLGLFMLSSSTLFDSCLSLPLKLPFFFSYSPSLLAMEKYFTCGLWFDPPVLTMMSTSLSLTHTHTHTERERENQEKTKSLEIMRPFKKRLRLLVLLFVLLKGESSPKAPQVSDKQTDRQHWGSRGKGQDSSKRETIMILRISN